MTLVDAVNDVAREFPDLPAIVIPGEGTTTYYELASMVRTLSYEVRNSYRAGTIGLNLGTAVEYVGSFLACLDIGYNVVPFPPRMSDKTRRIIEADMGLTGVLNEKPKVVGIGSRSVARGPQGSVIYMTSGSYGSHKFVTRSADNLLDEARSVASHLDLGLGMNVLVTTPLEHSFGCGMLRAILYAGATLYTWSGESFLDKLTSFKPILPSMDVITGVPYVFRRLLHGWTEGAPLKAQCYAGGETVQTSLSSEWLATTGRPLCQEYGLSETGIVTFSSPGDPPESIGRPTDGAYVSISDDELVVYRPHLPDKYYFGESPETFRNGGVRTGDLGRLEDGLLYLTGRRKSIIIVAGMKAFPGEIEAAICEFDVEAGIEAVVMSVPDERTGERPYAFVSSRGNGIDTSLLRQWLKSQLESYKLPKVIHYIEENEWPRTASGKVDREALREHVFRAKGGRLV